MASVQASIARPPAANTPDEADREKEFFTTWLRLMERQKDESDLTQEMQKLLDQSKDSSAIVQDAKHHANMMSANAKTATELVALLNEFFFRDIVPALKRAKQVEAIDSATQQQDSLDRYLEHGDEGTAMPQEFVDDMSGWAAPPRQETDNHNKNADGDDNEDNQDSGDEISGDMFHDMLIANNLKLTAMQGPDYSALMQGRMAAAAMLNTAAQAAGARPSTLSAAATRGKVMTNKHGRTVPPPIVTDLPPRPASSPAEADHKKDRIGKRTAANLIAKQVLGVRTYGSAREYFIQWQGVNSPLWISRRKCPPQAKQLIDLYLRSRAGGASPNQGTADLRVSSKGKKKTSRSPKHTATGNNTAAQGGEFYTVDHIVSHRLFYNRRQYLVRWENYDESEDTWENADKLRMDVPDIVDAYEEQLQRDIGRAEAVQSAMSELSQDGPGGPKSAAKKRTIGNASNKNTQLSAGANRVDGERSKEKKRRVEKDKEDKHHDADDQFDLEEAELEEFSDDEFADKLNN